MGKHIRTQILQIFQLASTFLILSEIADCSKKTADLNYLTINQNSGIY